MPEEAAEVLNQAPVEKPVEEAPAQQQAPAETPGEVEEILDQDPVEEPAEEAPAQQQAPAEISAAVAEVPEHPAVREEAPAQQQAPANEGRRVSNGRHALHVKPPCTLPECNHNRR